MASTRFLLRALPANHDRQGFLTVVKSISTYLGARAVNPKWTSYGALEIDLFAGSTGDLELVVAALEPLARIEFARNLDEPPTAMSKEEILAEAVRLFNAERFWEAHETLERIWRTSDGPEKRLVQGIILVCVAFVHTQKEKQAVAMGVVKRALKQLEWPEQTYHGVDVTNLRARMEMAVASGKLTVFRI